MKHLLLVVIAARLAYAQDPWEQASLNGEKNRNALLHCKRFVQGWLEHADPISGLIPQNLREGSVWNAQNAAADNYPFMVLTCFLTDRGLFEGPMKDVLATEQRLCNRVDRLPDDWLFETQTFRKAEPDMPSLIFGASEYVKDGLIPLTEFLGPSPWSQRLLGLLDDILNHAAVESEVGLLPATSHEVCGELMQSLSRMYWMTGNETYRAWAYRIADYFFVHHCPIEVEQLRLDDHGCEVIGGLSEVYFLAAHKDPERREAWRPVMHAVLDRVLEVGRDEHGLLTSLVNPRTGQWLTEDRTDNWGYNYNAFLVVHSLDEGTERYREAVAFVLKNLLENKDYPWERDGADGIADSLEGGLNLINRMPVPEALVWADHMANRLLAKQRDTGIVEGWHGDGNFARTALMYGLWKSRGAYVRPWRSDLRVGATVQDETTYFVVQSDWPWKGTLYFDVPRHAEYLHLPADYPRLNQFPEWFTVPKEATYETESGERLAAARLRMGLPISVAPNSPFRFALKKSG